MSDNKQRYPYDVALKVAEELKEILTPACELNTPVIAGSLRRKRQDIGDIELLCIPKVDIEQVFMVDRLDATLTSLMMTGLLDYRLNKLGRKTYGPQNKLMVHLPSGIGVDVFSTEERYFGMALIVRTGSLEFNKDIMTRFQEMKMQGHAYGGVTDRYGEDRDCPDEDTVFRFLGWQWIPPEKREKGQYRLYTLPH